MKLPKETLRPGASLEARQEEIKLLSPLAPKRKDVQRGCVPKNDSFEKIHVRVFNGRTHNLFINKEGVVTHNDARVHIDTVEEFHQYVVGLFSPTSIPKAGA